MHLFILHLIQLRPGLKTRPEPYFGGKRPCANPSQGLFGTVCQKATSLSEALRATGGLCRPALQETFPLAQHLSSPPSADGVHADARLDQRNGADAVDAHLLVGVVGVLAHQLDISLALRLLDVLDGDVLLAVDVNREQVHVAPEDVVDIVQLLVEHDIAALEQRIHRVAHHVDGAVALRQVGDVDVVHRLGLHVLGKERHQSGRPFNRVERHALQRQRRVGAAHVGRQVGLGVEHLALARLEPFGVDVQLLNQNVPVSRRKTRLSGFNHREGRLSDAKSLCQLLLCHVQRLSYHFYALVHGSAIGKNYNKKLYFRVSIFNY